MGPVFFNSEYAVVSKKGGGPMCMCPLDCDPWSKSKSLKVLVQGTNESLDPGKEKSMLPWSNDSATV